MAKLLVGRRHIVAERVVDNPVKPPNRRGDAESFRAARISTKMMTAWGQHQFRAAFGADMRKSWSVVVDHVHTQASPATLNAYQNSVASGFVAVGFRAVCIKSS